MGRLRRKYYGRCMATGEQLESRQLLAADLIAHWQAQEFLPTLPDGAPLSSWTDSLGQVSAAATGQPLLSHTALGGKPAVRFSPADGADSFQIGSLASPMRGAQDFTVALVFSTSSTQLVGGTDDWFANTALVDAYGLGFAADWGISINAAGQISVGLGGGFTGPTTSLYSDQAGYHDGQTHLVVFRRQGNQATLQINDEAPTVASGVSTTALSSLDVTIGDRKFGSAPFDGYLAELRIYNGALDAAQTSSLYGEFVATYNNQAPRANDESYTLVEDTPLFVTTTSNGVLLNDVDVESDALTALLVEPPEHGTLLLRADGAFAYTPHKDFFGTDRFTYSAVDFRPSAPATVTLNVTPVYDGVRAAEDQYKALPSEPLRVEPAQGVLANDLNPDRASLAVILEQDTNDGQLSLNPDGSFTYEPNGFVGATSFRYRVDDGTQQTAPITVNLVVNTPPVSVADRYSVNEDTVLIPAPDQGVLHNDVDADGHALTAELIEQPQHGTLAFDPSGQFTYTAQSDYFGPDRFTYRVTDGVDWSEPIEVALEVVAVNDPPVVARDSYFTLPSRLLEVPAERGLLANDRDVDSPVLTASLVTGPRHGSVVVSPSGGFQYTPVPGYLGADSFTYIASDGIDPSAPVDVQITVSDRPVVINEFLASNADALQTRVRSELTDSFRGSPSSPDWIELRNLVSEPIDLSGMHLSDDPNDLTKWTFPEGTSIPAEGYLVLFASGLDIRDAGRDEQGFLHTNFRIDTDGEFLAISAQDGTPIHQLDASAVAQFANVSYGLMDDSLRYFSPASPGQQNTGGLVDVVAQPVFSHERGYYDAPFQLQLSVPTPGAALVYTTDGREPSPTVGTVVLPSDPNSLPQTTLTIDRTTTLRVMAYKDGYLSPLTQTQTYFFVDDLVNQSNLWSTVTNDPVWGPQLRSSLMSVPSISLVMDGRISEAREIGTSVELIFPDGTEGFQINAGVEHYGGHSLGSPKKNMRLSFKALYGDGRLEYDLFGEGAATDFDQLILRTGSHDNWFWTHPAGGQGNYIRNRWAFDRQLEMGHLAPHGRYVQVFINGEYWGMHHLMERPNASFMASYLGGDPADYDALNAGTPIDGDNTAWRAVQTEAVIDDYQQVQQYLDVVNYADYMLLQFYAGNDWDWNHSQNWAAARKREAGAGFVFFSWDSDVMLRTTASANVISRGGPGNLWNVRGGMRQHDEFLLLMADRAHRYFFNGGMLTNERLRHDIDQLAESIRLPIVAETARWGRLGFQGLRYTPGAWEEAIDWMKSTYAPEGRSGRTETVLNQLRRAGIYPDIDAPEYTVNQVRQHGGEITDTDRLHVVAAAGTVYYTLDGSDPRLPGGALNPQALQYEGQPIPIAPMGTVKARAFDPANNEWSALSEATFRVRGVPADTTNLRISEVHYHPADPTPAELAAGFDDGDDFEFIELVNISQDTVDLSQVRLQRITSDAGDNGVDFVFAQSDIALLAPGERLLVVENTDAFAARYGTQLPVAGQWSGGLNNAEEQITLMAGETILHQFRYSDRWYPETDGNGFSLEIVNPAQDRALWEVAQGWRASAQSGGSPGTDGITTRVPGDSNGDGVFNSRDLVLVFQAGKYEAGAAGNATWEEGDWNGDGVFTSRDLVHVFQQGTYITGATMELLTERQWDVSNAERKRRSFEEAAPDVDLTESVATEPTSLATARDLIFEGWR